MATLPHEDEAFAGSPETPPEKRTALALLRNVVVDLTQVVEDSTELIGASVREELAQFREDLARHALSLVAIVIGGALLTAGLAMLVSGWIGNWPVTLLIFGGIYIAFALGLRLGKPRRDEDGWK
jgi:uncharacterized membrane protein